MRHVGTLTRAAKLRKRELLRRSYDGKRVVRVVSAAEGRFVRAERPLRSGASNQVATLMVGARFARRAIIDRVGLP